MERIETPINGVCLLKPKVFGDSRGYFFESFTMREFRRLVGDIDFVQDNESKSSRGVIRGLHFQHGEAAQAKLVRVAVGRVLDIAVDIRPGSPTFGRYFAAELSEDNHLQMFLPRGMAHGFAVLSETALFEYKCDNYYCPEAEGAIIWNDPDLAIDWGLSTSEICLSDKDRRHPRLKDISPDLLNFINR